MLFLSVDFGTSSVKLSVVDDTLRILESAKREYDFTILPNQGVEIGAETMFDAFVAGLADLKEFLPDIEAVGYDTFSPSLVLMDSKGSAVHPVLTHLDRRSRAQTEDICARFGMEAFRSITGVLPFSGGVTITSVLWMKENMPESFAKTAMIGHLNTYVYKRLTGVWATDPVNASMMGLYETVTRSGWSRELCDFFKIPLSILPPIHDAGTVLSGLSKDAAVLTGLREGIPVSIGSNDAATAQVAAGNTRDGDIMNISGSSEMISIISDKPIVDPNYYLRCAVTPARWQFYAITSGGFAIEWFRSNFCGDMTQDAFYRTYIPRVIACGNVDTVRFAPHLAGDRQSLEKKHGTFTGLTLGTTRDDMLLALLTGIHEPVIKTIEVAKAHTRLSPAIKLTGGLIRESYVDLKKRLLPGFEFEVFDEGPIVGNVKLLLENL